MMSADRTAVATGACSGIGLATAREIARHGFHVLAGVRRRQDAERLATGSDEPVIVDITDGGQVPALADRVARAARGRRPGAFVACCRTKLARVLFTRAFAERQAGAGVTACSLHPGVTSTDLANDIAPSGPFFANALLPGTKKGAITSVFPAIEPGMEQYTGRYFSYRTFLRSRGMRPAKASPFAEDRALREKLRWSSAGACGLAA